MNFYRKIKKQLNPLNLTDKAKENPKSTILIILIFGVFLYVVFNSNGIYPRIKLEHQKQQMLEKIKKAEEEQQELKDRSNALDGDKQAIEKVAREKHGMVRDGEKIYKVVPKK